MRCADCGASTPVGICIFCGADDPRGGMEQAAAVTGGMRLAGVGCAGALLAFAAWLLWGTLRPGVYERNQFDHPSLAAARQLISQRRYSAALDALRKAPSRSALTADYRGLALLGMNGYRPGDATSLGVSRAAEAFREALEIDSDLGPAYLHLAACQAMLHEDKVVTLATLERLKKGAGATFPHDGSSRDRLLYAGRQMTQLVESDTPFVALVCVDKPRELQVKTFNLQLAW